VEEGHLVAGCAVALSQARGLVPRWLGRDDWRRQREEDLVFLKAAVAGAIVEPASWWGTLGRHPGGVWDQTWALVEERG
jgi:hypothetical protein